MIGLEVTVSCSFCAAPVEPVSVGDPDGTMSATTVRCTACRSVFTVTAVMTATTVRFPYEPLERYVTRSMEIPAHEGTACRYCNASPDRSRGGYGCASAPMIGRMCGVSADTVQKWKTHAMDDRRADRVATALGAHPSVIWPDQWAALCAGDLEGADT